MIGRIIFANLLEQPVQRYFNFVKRVESQHLLERWLHCGWVWKENLADIAPLLQPVGKDGVIGKYVIKGQNEWLLLYFHPYFQHHYGMHESLWRRFFDGSVEKRLLHRLRRINSRNLLTHCLLSAIAEEQKDYLSTGDVHRLKPLTLLEVANRMRNASWPPAARRGNPQSICHTWLSRLIRTLHVMLPDGLVCPFAEMVPSRRDLMKQALRKLLNEESHEIIEGTLEAPYTDSQLQELLRGRFNITTTRYNVTSIRRELGIPAARGRSQDFWHILAAVFSGVYPLTVKDIALNVPQSCGVYEIRLRDSEIAYPRGRSSIFYIGRSKNLCKRLTEHLQPRARNKTMRDYVQGRLCGFRFLAVEESCYRREEKRLYDLFVSTFGASPKFNRVNPVRG